MKKSVLAAAVGLILCFFITSCFPLFYDRGGGGGGHRDGGHYDGGHQNRGHR